MSGTLTWKEIREHQATWLTMAFMTVGLGWGLPRIVAQGNPFVFLSVSLLTILGMTVANGVVCGAMMFAGEHEGGTLVFLDIFHGRRGQLWSGKAAIGAVLVVTEGLAVAAVPVVHRPRTPRVGRSPESTGPLCIPERARDLVRDPADRGPRSVRVGAARLLADSPRAAGRLDRSGRRLRLLDVHVLRRAPRPHRGPAHGGDRRACVLVRQLRQPAEGILAAARRPGDRPPTTTTTARRSLNATRTSSSARTSCCSGMAERDRAARAPDLMLDRDGPAKKTSPRRSAAHADADASSPREVLWWLVFEQYRTPLVGMAVGCFLVGVVVSAYAQVLWPIATLILGVVCGVAAFGPEQRDQSYQFLAAEHFPLRAIWAASRF